MGLTIKEQHRFDELQKIYPNGKVINKPLLGFGEATVFVDENNNIISDITDYDTRIDDF